MSSYPKWEDFLSADIDSWRNTTMGELFAHRQEKNRPELPLLSVTGEGGVVDRDSLDRRDTSNADKSKYLRVSEGDIVYNTMRMWQGVSGVAQKDGLVSPAYTVLEPKETIASSFAKYLVKDKRLVQVFHKNSQGLVDDTLNLKFANLNPIRVKIPPLPEQKKIASILTSVDEVIENTQKQIDKLQDLKKATMNELLTKGIGHTKFKDSELGRIPKSWEVYALSEIGTFSKGRGISKKETLLEGVPCLRYAEIYTVYDFHIKTFKSFISPITAESSRKLIKNEIIFAGSGETVEDIGKSVAFTLDCDAYVGGDSVVFSPRSGLDSIFLSYQLNDNIRRRMLRKLGQGSSVIHIYSSGLQEVLVSLPPLSEQKKIASILISMGEAIEEKLEESRKLQSLKKSLMQDLLTGKVRVNVN